ncbi:MAG: hypothetical protein R2795_05365 [Saprospiraceae bacterium]
MKNYIIALCLMLMAGTAVQAQDFFTESFAGGIPAGWSNIMVQGNGAANAVWLYTTAGPTGDFATDPIASETAADGWMMFDSDANCAAAPQDAWLITPAIDCSDKSAVWIRFSTFYRSFNCRPQIRVGTDLNDLASWATYEVFPGVTANSFGGSILGEPDLNPQPIQLDLSEAAAGVAGVYVAFQFLSDASTANGGDLTGCAYNWQVDDMVLTEIDPRPANQMQVNSFAAVAPNAITPASQVEPIGFIADIANFGSATQPQTTLSMPITNNNGDVVFTDQLIYGEIAPDSTAENVFFPNEFDVPAVPEIYTATYALDYEGIEEDAIPGNNELTFVFAVSDTLFSKDIGATRGVTPAGENSYTYGNVYYINSATDLNGAPLYARYIEFGVTNANNLAGRFATIFLYEWTGDANENFTADQDEYNIAGFNSYEFLGNEGNNTIRVLANDGLAFN